MADIGLSEDEINKGFNQVERGISRQDFVNAIHPKKDAVAAWQVVLETVAQAPENSDLVRYLENPRNPKYKRPFDSLCKKVAKQFGVSEKDMADVASARITAFFDRRRDDPSGKK